MMKESEGFYTMKGYELRGEGDQLSSAMEDYLEMITRLTADHQRVRVSDLSRMLHVKASSVTKMVQHLTLSGYLHAEKYGEITLTDRGIRQGDYLLHRHEVLHRFLCLLNHSGNELEQVEKIEHFLDERTIKNLELLIAQLEKP
jgi:Mn-dependent DtxR family transcriptional regulator